MKKFIVIAAVLALLVPSLAFAAAEFSLGGFVKLDSFWDSTQQGKNMNGNIARNNNGNFQHGRTVFTAQGSRFNFTIKGPKVFGAATTGFIEMDFDSSTDQNRTTSNSYVPRLRHAMFRFNWPETELLFGQYWSMFCEWYPELVEDGPFMATGMPTARMAQVRLTQKFLGWGTAAFLVGNANNANNGQNYSASDTSGESTAAPQVQGKLMYAQDLWGKAAYYGRPIPFTASLVAGWQRQGFAQSFGLGNVRTFGQNTYSALLAPNVKHTTLDPWLVMFSTFIPVIPTHSANLAGTASILTQWFIGQGLDSWGFTGMVNQLKFNKQVGGVYTWDYELQKRWGGFVQGQYYFTNQWFITAAYGINKAFGVSQDRDAAAINANNPAGSIYAFTGDAAKMQQQAEVALWYRPVQAIKFGLEYAYGATNWFQSTGGGGGNPAGTSNGTDPFNNYANPSNTSNFGAAHRVEFVGFFYF
ncbi:MAG: hypothetical protein M0P73_07125 [Syntrophobacterales bacterium]|jgi:hypothetical protein|nr:hypothetical protein [Syntrophobacterales bacterium]